MTIATAHGNRLPFRPDIEGLRAVAIMLVVLAHAKVPWLAGGFVGVDVFFVLSGYLITGLLLHEFRATGELRLTRFYARRLQRLLPGLLLVVACTMVAAAILLAPFEQIPQSTAAGTAATWTSNLYFALTKLDYFGSSAESNLFLHTWSLGVEEQFYLLWPALLLFLLGAWGWQGRRTDFPRLWSGMRAMAAICLALCMLLTYVAPQLAFYMVFSRGWQFALGALVFMALAQPNEHGRIATAARRMAVPLGWLGLVAILVTAALLDTRTAYPGAWSLLPSMGTAAVLAASAARNPRHGVGALLSTTPMQGIGRVSYAWYLWHWPTLLLGLSVFDPANPLQIAGLVALSFVLALISCRLVEAPLRRSPTLHARPRFVLSGGVAMMLVALATSVLWNRQAIDWAQQPDQARYLKARADGPAIYDLGCDDWYRSARVRFCAFGQEDARHTVVLMGDSIAGQWFPAVAKVFDRPDWRLLVLTKSSCPMVDKPLFDSRIGREYTECAQWRREAIRILAKMRPDLVLLSSVPSPSFSHEEWIEGTSAVLAPLVAGVPRVGILQPTPILPFNGPACLAREDWRSRYMHGDGDCSTTPDDSQWLSVRAALATSTARFPSVRLLDLTDAICPGHRCASQRNGVVVYRDEQHLTATFVAELAPALGTALRQAGLDPAAAPKPGN